jgi:hypothetical protein
VAHAELAEVVSSPTVSLPGSGKRTRCPISGFDLSELQTARDCDWYRAVIVRSGAELTRGTISPAVSIAIDG